MDEDSREDQGKVDDCEHLSMQLPCGLVRVNDHGHLPMQLHCGLVWGKQGHRRAMTTAMEKGRISRKDLLLQVWGDQGRGDKRPALTEEVGGLNEPFLYET